MATPDLPDDIEALKALLLAQQAQLDQAQARVSALEAAAASHTASDAPRAAETEYLKVMIAKLKKLAFGRKSEKYDAQLEQLELQLDERIADEAASPAGMRGETAHTRKPATRNPLPDHLLREDNILQPKHDACSRCGNAMRLLGEDISEQLEYVPSSFKVIRHVRPKYACTCCEHIAKAPAAARPIARGVTGPGLLAHVLVAKFADHLALNRRSDIYAREGVNISRSTLAGWVGQSAALPRPWWVPCSAT